MITFMLTLFLAVPAQKKMTDSEFEGYKGAVKSVLTEYIKIEKSKGSTADKKRKTESQYFFDKDGRLAQVLYPATNYKVVFKIIDGYKTFKSMKIKNMKPGNFLGSVQSRDEKPIEGPDKIVSPDNRFDEKYLYEYDSQGRIKTERKYLDNGKLITLKTFKYDEKGRVIEENENAMGAITKFNYKYNEEGNLIEMLSNRNIKGAGTDSTGRTVYSEYKVDAQGNWTQRKESYFVEVDGKERVNELIYFRTIVYYQ